MNEETKAQSVQDLPEQIIDTFLKKLGDTGVSSDVIDRVNAVVTGEKKPTAKAIETALFQDNEQL